MQWRNSNQSTRPLSPGDMLLLTTEGSSASQQTSAPALLHFLRTRLSIDAAPYLDQALATYPGGMSELDAALQLLHLLDEGLEVGEVTIFVEGAGATPFCPHRTNPVYDGTIPTPPYTVVCNAFPWSPTGALASRQPPTLLAAGRTHTCPRPYSGPGAPTTEGTSSGKSARAPPCSTYDFKSHFDT